ncbi:MAG: phenylalanine--tRNA ligase subunit beta [Chloroflexota bacterium]
MRVPISWLKDFVDITLPVAELAEKLTIAGLEVEAIHYIGIPGGNDKDRLVWDREKLVVGHILQVEQHPNADRLVLATVDYGAEENEVVVTGAPNLFQFLGKGDISEQKIYSPFALEGAYVYDGHKEGQVKMKLKGRSLRGIHNRCMVCSEKELGLSEEHEGIMFIEGDQIAGASLQDVLGDAVLEIDIIPNIARCASIIGVAREVAAQTGQTMRYPSYDVVMEGPSVEGKIKLTTANPDLNPRFTGMIITGVEQNPSPQWMQRRLQLAGQRPLNVVVDISNYVMLEMGQPNHTFDYDFLRRRADQYDPDGPVHIHTRLPEEGETVTTLDGTKRDMPPFTILVTDPEGALSIGGIMGGAESEIADDTTNVLLEAAAWNFMNIRRSASGLKLNTEAGFRFSRGVHPSQALLGAKRAAELLRTLAGGTVMQGIIDYYPQPPEENAIALTSAEVKRLGGIDQTLDEIKTKLEALEFLVEMAEDHVLATAPDHRIDITGSHDLVEEVCRVYGYDNLPSTEMSDLLPPQRTNVSMTQEARIKDSLAQIGLQEIITYRLTSEEREAKLIPSDSGLPTDERPFVTLSNPITVDRVVMRHSLLASVMEIVAANSRFKERIGVFEIGQIYLAGEDSILPDELTRLSIVLTGSSGTTHWQGGDAHDFDFFDLKGIVEALLADLHIDGLQIEAATHPSYRPGYTARLLLNGQHLGILGELHPLVVEAFDVRTERPVLATELDLDLLMSAIPERYGVTAVPTYPAVREDLAVVVDQDVSAAKVAEVIERTGGFLLKDVTLFDVYEGEQLPSGKKSLAYRLTYQAPNKTLSDRDVGKMRKRIIKQLGQRVNAKLR